MESENTTIETPGVSRRLVDILLGSSIIGLAASIIYPLLKFMTPPHLEEMEQSTVLAAQEGELKPNSGKVFRFGNEPAILVRKPNADYVAFTAICTHLQCTVQYRSDLEHIWCACHNGHYDLTGKNISGPPPRPLQPYGVKEHDHQIWVTRDV